MNNYPKPAAAPTPAPPAPVDFRADIDRTFFGVMSVSSALCFGAIVATIQSLEKDQSGFAFHVTFATAVAFVLGTLAGLACWWIVPINNFTRRLSTPVLLLIAAASFFYPLRFLPRDKFWDLLQGLSLAAFALSLGAILLLKLKKFFDADQAAAEAKDHLS